MLEKKGLVKIKSNGKYKIGKARDVKHRINNLQAGSHKRFRLVLKLKSSNNTILERLCHRKFSDKRVRGEWFDLNRDDLKWIRNLPLI
jgi:hypothetical protein